MNPESTLLSANHKY